MFKKSSLFYMIHVYRFHRMEPDENKCLNLKGFSKTLTKFSTRSLTNSLLNFNFHPFFGNFIEKFQ